MKNELKKIIGLLVLIVLLTPMVALGQPAQTGNNPSSQSQTGPNPSSQSQTGSFIFQNPLKGTTNSIPQLVNNLFDAIIQIGLVFVVMAIIYSGLQFILAQGNEDKLKKARSVFLYTVIGGVILLGAGVITEVVCNTANQFLTNQISC